ncbi:hypothetical protein EG329_002752 [Mollisiaceae sp. DMI_Dod_QoI]|nr:hypothetical protein EG329_002752 [Helotiales sp. DMI_Dod_QoI]
MVPKLKSKHAKPQGVGKRVAGKAQRFTRSSSKGQKFLEYEDGPKVFSVFQIEQKVPNRFGKEVTKTAVVSPETGIHSLQWAQSTLPQPASPILALPIEVRNRIYHYVFTSNKYLKPKNVRRLAKFINASERSVATDPLLIKTYINLSLACRQLYIETTGSGILHRLATFSFPGPEDMKKYLSVINPFHKSVIRTIVLDISLTCDRSPSFLNRMVARLGSMDSLEFLKVKFEVPDKPFYRFSFLMRSFFVEIEDEALWRPLKGKLKGCEIEFVSYIYPGRNWTKTPVQSYETLAVQIRGWLQNTRGSQLARL